MIPLFFAAWGSPLEDAVQANDVKLVARLLSEGADAHEPIARSTTQKRFNLFRSTTVTTTVHTSPLHLAVDRALEGDTRMLTVFLKGGVAADRASGSHLPPLHRAAAAGAKGTRALEALLDGGVDADARFRHQTALARADHPATTLVSTLLGKGAEPSVLICDAGAAEELELLLAAGADPDAACPVLPVLLAAVARQDAASLAKLATADPQRVALVEGHAVTALGLASLLGWVEGVQLLVARGVDPDAPAGLLGQRPLDLATGDARSALLAAGAKRLDVQDAGTWDTPPREGEQGAWLASWLAYPEVSLHGWQLLARPEIRSLLERLGSAALLRVGGDLDPDGIELAGAVSATCLRPPMRRSDLFGAWGTPKETRKQGLLRTWIWDDRTAIGSGQIVAEAQGGCFAELVGQPRGVVWLALGVPARSSPDLDVLETGVRLRYREGRFLEVSHLGEPWDAGK